MDFPHVEKWQFQEGRENSQGSRKKTPQQQMSLMQIPSPHFQGILIMDLLCTQFGPKSREERLNWKKAESIFWAWNRGHLGGSREKPGPFFRGNIVERRSKTSLRKQGGKLLFQSYCVFLLHFFIKSSSTSIPETEPWRQLRIFCITQGDGLHDPGGSF